MSKRYRKTSNTPTWVWIVAIILALAFLSSLASNLAIDAPAGGGGATDTPGSGVTDPPDSGGKHTHVYNQKVKGTATLKEAATCTTAATYYYSCTCGDVSTNGTVIFFDGTALGHNFVDGACTRCNVLDADTCAHNGEVETNYVPYNIFDISAGGLCGTPQHCVATYCEDCRTWLSHGDPMDCSYVNSVDYDMKCDLCGTSDVHGVSVTYTSFNNGTHYRVASKCTECGKTPYASHMAPCVYTDGVCQYCGYINPDYGDHTHVYDQEKVESKYLQTAPTCNTNGFYYYSCLCGEAGTKTFSVPKLAHTYVNGVCTVCEAVNPNYEQVDAFVDHQPVLNADQTAFEWSGNWTLGDLDTSGNYREFNTVHQDYNDTAFKWLIYTPDVVDPYPDGFWNKSAGYRVTAPYQVGVVRDYDMIIVWTAPEDGTVKIGATNFNIISAANSYNLRLYLNDTLVYPSEDYLNIGYGDAIDTDEELVEALKDVIITVKAGDKLQFRCSRITQGMNIAFMPTVEYQACEHSETVSDFDGQFFRYTCKTCGAFVEEIGNPNAFFTIDARGYNADLLESYGFLKGMSWMDFLNQEYTEWLYDANNGFVVVYNLDECMIGLPTGGGSYFVLKLQGEYVDAYDSIIPGATYTLVHFETN